MSLQKKLSAVLVGAAALALVGVSPAVAAGSAIDAGDSLYSIVCNAGTPVYNDWQLLGVNASTGVSTTIGSGTGSIGTDQTCAAQPAYNPVTKKSYYIKQVSSDGPTDYLLAEITVSTGVSSAGTQFFVSSPDTFFPTVDAIAIGLDGSAFAISDGILFRLNLDTAELVEIDYNPDLVNADAFAVDPTTGQFYVIGYPDAVAELLRVDTSTAGATSLGEVSAPSGPPVSLQIDGGGRFWVIQSADVAPGDPGGASLWSFTLSTLSTPVYSGELVDGTYYSRGLLLVPGVALANTGTDTGALALIGAGAVVFFAVGVVLVSRRRVV